MNSALPRMVQPVASEARFSLMSGVLPIASTTSLLIFMSGKIASLLPILATTLERDGSKWKPVLCCCSQGSYLGFANTTWRTSIFPDRNPASQ